MPIKTEAKVGLFIVVSVLLILAGLAAFAYKKGLFEPEQTFTLSSATGEGLTVGMPLMFSGFKIGKITDLQLSEEGKVLIRISVPRRHTKWLRTDSQFVLERPLIGSTRLSVRTTNLTGAQLAPKAMASVMEVNDINETIKRVQPIIEKVARITEHIEVITRGVADPQGNIQQLLAKPTLLDMAVGDKESVAAIQASLKNTRAITAKVDGLLKKTDDSLYGPDGAMPHVIKSLKELANNLTKVGTTLDNVNKISGEAADASKDLKLLRAEIDAAVNSINNMISEINKKLPFRSEPKLSLP